MVKKYFPILIILTIWFIFSYPVFLQNKIALPADHLVNTASLWNFYEEYWGPVKNPAMPDVLSQIYPWKKFTIEMLKMKEIPFWDPYSFSGTPHLANYQSAVFSITNLFYFIFDFKNAWNLSVIIQPLLAGIFTYLFTKSLKLSNGASLLSSVSFMFCGFITTWMNYTTLALAISFLPLSLYLIEKYFSSNKIYWLPLLSISICLSFLSGHFQTSLYLGLFTYGYILLKLIQNKNWNKFIYLNIFYFLGFLLASPQLLPTLEFYFNSYRSKNFGKVSPLPINHLPLIIAPDFYGNPVTRNNFSLIYAEYSAFAGTIPFFLALFAIISKYKTIYFFILTAFLSLIFSLNTPLADLIVNAQIPVISSSSLSRILVIFSFSIAILAGYGFDSLIFHLKEKNLNKIIFWFFICFVILGIIWLYVITKNINPQYYSIAIRNLIIPSGLLFWLILFTFIGFKKSFLKFSIALIILLTIFEMLRFAIKWQPYTAKEFVYPETLIINKLTQLDNIYRTNAPITAEGSLYYHIPITDGYNPLYINRYGEFIASIQDGKIQPAPRYTVQLPYTFENLNRIIDFMNIKYVLIKKSDLKQPWVFPINKFSLSKFQKIYSDKNFMIFKNNEVFPRVFLVGDYTVENNNQEIIDKILKENFDLKKNTILEIDPKINKTRNLMGEAKIIKYSPNKIIIKTNANNNSLLVLSDSYYPGWGVKINNAEGKILRANYAFRAVPIPKGESTIEFYYYPKSFKWGVYLALFSVITITLIILGKWYTNAVWNKQHKTAKPAIKLPAENVNGKPMKKKQLKSKRGI